MLCAWGQLLLKHFYFSAVCLSCLSAHLVHVCLQIVGLEPECKEIEGVLERAPVVGRNGCTRAEYEQELILFIGLCGQDQNTLEQVIGSVIEQGLESG